MSVAELKRQAKKLNLADTLHLAAYLKHLERRKALVFLRPKRDGRLSWDDTFRAMGAEQRRDGHEFFDFDTALDRRLSKRATVYGGSSLKKNS